MILAIHFARLGPYHETRLRAASEVLSPLGWRVGALEVAGLDATYGWDRLISEKNTTYERFTVFPDQVFENIPPREMRQGIARELDRIGPDAVAIAGWGTVDARACLDWCKKHGSKAIVMSETRAADGHRVWWREWLKSWIVRRFDGALCGGESHKRYLMQLGMPPERIAFGYNVVDNEFFGGIRNAKCEIGNGGKPENLKKTPASALDSGHSPLDPRATVAALEAPYFLASNRFVERKNLANLIRAYASYVESVQSSAFSFQKGARKGIWPLVLLGDGELRVQLEELAQKLELTVASVDSKLNSEKFNTPSSGGLVVFAGFRQINELPAFYAGAGAFVHPAWEEPWGLVINEAMASGLPVLSSKNVGAAEELVEDGVTGFLFDPGSVNGMADSFLKIASMPESKRVQMGMAACERLECKAPSRAFGQGLASLLLMDVQYGGCEI